MSFEQERRGLQGQGKGEQGCCGEMAEEALGGRRGV